MLKYQDLVLEPDLHMISFHADGLYPSQCEIKYVVDEDTIHEHTKTLYFIG